jgi:hypothetical protein
MIRNHEYEASLPDNAEVTQQKIKYGGYVFKISAICFGTYDHECSK